MTATMNDALVFCRSMGGRAEACGYFFALYGSVLKNGEGRDIDVVAIPIAHGHRQYERLLQTLASAGWREQGERYFGQMDTCAALLRHPHHDFVVDLQIREAGRHHEASLDRLLMSQGDG